MNLFIKSYRTYPIFFLLITCVSGMNKGFSQEGTVQPHPWIQEIYLPPSLEQLPNETFCSNELGELFVGKNTGLMVVGSRQLQFLDMQGPVYVARHSQDTLFYAAENDLGLLVRGDSNRFEAISKAFRLPVSRRHFRPTALIPYRKGFAFNNPGGCFYMSPGNYGFEEGLELERDTIPDKQAILAMLSRQTGIPEGAFTDIREKGPSSYWVLSEFALHHFRWPAPLTILDKGLDEAGSLFFSLHGDQGIYLGASKGLFLLRAETGSNRTGRFNRELQRLSGKEDGSVHLFSREEGSLYAGGDRGLYQVIGASAILVHEGQVTGLGAIDPEHVLLSGPRGTLLLEKDGAHWQKRPLKDVPGNAYSFVRQGDDIFFVAWDKVYRYSIERGLCFPVAHEIQGRVMTLMPQGDRLILQAGEQAGIYEAESERFVAVESARLSARLASTRDLEMETSGLCWILGGQGNRELRLRTTGDLMGEEPPEDAFPLLSELEPFNHLDLQDGLLYLTSRKQIVILDLGLLRGLEQLSPPRIPGGELIEGELVFQLQGLELQKDPPALFRHRFRPGQRDWSDWHTSRKVRVPVPGPGKYQLEVEMMDLYGRISQVVHTRVRIPYPWYLLWYSWILYTLVVGIVFFLLRKWWMLGYQRAESRVSARMEKRIDRLTEEKDLSDALVAEILPEKAAREIRREGKAKPEKYAKATVLFSDIQGFTKIAEEMNPEVLIDELDKFFFHFDSVVEKYNIEKIKTIGDAYMAAGGIPRKNSTNPVEVVLAALEMQAYMRDLKNKRAEIWDLRIGIHSGPVIAGVVGHKKISYDIWGDTVNTASRMESSGEPGKVNISGITYGMVKEYFMCEYRGKLPVKYKGNIDMYFVNGLRPELAVDLKGLPNRRFRTKLQLLRLTDLEERVSGILELLPDKLHFHTKEYALKLYNQAFLLCRAEEVEQEDRLLIRTASLMLFTGLSQSYLNFENRSAVIARDVLPEFAYSERQVDIICNLILSTKVPVEPNNEKERIMVDLRMEYLGRPDFPDRVLELFRELRENGVKLNGQQFKKQQVELLYGFDYNTVAARRLREVSGQEQMARLEEVRII